jgi:signal transduction histidine kinase
MAETTPTRTEARLARRLEAAEGELRIQAAVGRVLQRSLAMDVAEDIADVVEHTRDALVELGFEPMITHIAIFDEDRDLAQSWHAKYDRPVAVRQGYRLSIAALRKTGSSLLPLPRGRTRYRFVRYNRTQITTELRKWRRSQLPGNPDWSITSAVDGSTYPLYRHHFFFSGGTIGLDLSRELTRAEIALGRRIADAFDVAYKRFVELQQKEQQNRELTIQNALERVRARALGMQSSTEIGNVASLLSQEFRGLGYAHQGISIAVERHFWAEQKSGWKVVRGPGQRGKKPDGLRNPDPQRLKQQRRAHAAGEPWFVFERQGKTLRDLTRYYWLAAGIPEQEVEANLALVPDRLILHRVFHESGLVEFASEERLCDDDLAVAKRFVDIFDIAYRRFRELEQKEQRNRELEIDHRLERVRADVASMTKSGDLVAVVEVVAESLQGLGVPCTVVGIETVDEAAGLWHTHHVGEGVTAYPLSAGPAVEVYDHWKSGETWHRQWPASKLKRNAKELRAAGFTELADRWDRGFKGYTAGLWSVDVPFAHGSVAMHKSDAEGQFSDDDVRLLERFAEVVSLAYTRFLDFQRLEADAQRARIERAAERIRAEAMAMTSTKDLVLVSGLVAHELRGLGIPTQSCMIFFLDEEHRILHRHLAFNVDLDELEIPYDPDRVQRLPIGSYVSYDGRAISDPPTAQERSYFDKLQSRGTEIQEFPDEHVEKIWHDGNDLTDFGIDSTLHNHKLLGDDYGMMQVVAFWRQGMLGTRSCGITPDMAPQLEAALSEFGDALALGFTRFQDFQRLEQESVNKSQFLRRMSHDLRSPMNAIIGYTRLLQRRLADRMDPREARNLGNIETSSGNLLNLINDILDLSRIEAGRIDLNMRPVDVAQLANECADALESIVQQGVVLRRDLRDVGSIHSDSDRLRQVIMNLLGNATKFTEAGSITLSVKKSSDGRVELSITDTGIGIPAEDLPHIFDEFRQVERQGGEGAEGTGLGLAIAKKTVDLLGGEITATSQVGVGTTFAVKLGTS